MRDYVEQGFSPNGVAGKEPGLKNCEVQEYRVNLHSCPTVSEAYPVRHADTALHSADATCSGRQDFNGRVD